MSGSSSDTEINVKIGATATAFEAACKAATTSMQSLKATVDSFATSMQSATGQIGKATPAMEGMRNASVATAEALRGTNQAASSAAMSTRALIDATTGVSRAQNNAFDSAEVFRKALGDASNETKALRGFFEEANEGAGHFAHGTSGVTRELIVMAHEAVSGNFTRIPGSLMVLGERMGGLTISTLAWAAAIGAAVYAVYELASGWLHVEEAVRAAQGAQVTVGTWSSQSDAQTRSSITKMVELWGLNRSEAAKVAALYGQLGGAAVQYRGRIEDVGHALAKLTGADEVETAQELVKVFNGGAEAIVKWAEAHHYVEGEAARAIETLAKVPSSLAAEGKLLDALEAKFGNSGKAAAQATQALKAYIATAQMLGPDGIMSADIAPNLPTKEQLTIGKPGTPAPSPQEIDQSAIIHKNTAALNEIREIDLQLIALEDAKKRGVEGAEEAIATARRRRAGIHLTLDRNEHEATVAALDAELIAAKDNADKRLEITRNRFEETKRYDSENPTAIAAAAHAVQQAEIAADDQHYKLKMAKLAGEEAAAKGALGEQIAIENKKLAAMVAAGKAGTVEYQNELNRRTALEKQAGDEAAQIGISKLRGDQEAAMGDYAAQLAIQDKIVAMTRAHYVEGSAQLQTELNKQQRLRAEAARQSASLAVQELEEHRRLLDEKLREDMRHVEAQRMEDALSVEGARQAQVQLIETYRSAAEQILAAEAKKSAGQRAMAEQVAKRQQELAQQTASLVQRTNDQAAQETQRAWMSAERQIASTFASEATSVLSGQRTLVQAIGGLGQRMVQDAIGWAARKALAWAQAEFLQTAVTRAQAAIRGTADAPSFLANIASMLGRWLGFEGAKTAATTAAATTRTAEESAAATIGTTAKATAARLNIAAAAAEAAAWAFADSASLGPPGLIAAPGVAAATEATVMAFQGLVPALAVGAWDLPHDTLAQLHKGEMVVPATFASGLRAAASGGGDGGMGGGGGDTNVHFHVSALDGASVAAFIRSNGRAIAQVVAGHQSRNPSLRPAF